MLNYGRIQRATVARLRAFNAAATAQTVAQRLREVANRAARWAAIYSSGAKAGAVCAGDRPGNRVAHRA